METTLEKKQRVNLLLDLYEDLLTEKQREYVDLYYKDDLSLSEIAENLNVSRNAVFDNLKKTVNSLEKYEQKLKLLEKHIERLALINKIEDHVNEDRKDLEEYLELLKNI